jgi:hypothetical protein
MAAQGCLCFFIFITPPCGYFNSRFIFFKPFQAFLPVSITCLSSNSLLKLSIMGRESTHFLRFSSKNQLLMAVSDAGVTS